MHLELSCINVCTSRLGSRPGRSGCRATSCAQALSCSPQAIQAREQTSRSASEHASMSILWGWPAQALADLRAQADGQALPREALQEAARWLFASLEARCGGRVAPAAGTAPARQFCALLRALAAVLSEVGTASVFAPSECDPVHSAPLCALLHTLAAGLSEAGTYHSGAWRRGRGCRLHVNGLTLLGVACPVNESITAHVLDQS